MPANWTGAPAECALMSVRIRLVGTDDTPTITASAVLGEWAATPSRHKRGRFMVTHIRTGLSTGPDLTERQAMQTVARLRDVSISTREELLAARDTIIAAHPVHARKWFPPIGDILKSVKGRDVAQFILEDK